MRKINTLERLQMVKAMEFIVRRINDESILIDNWLTYGVADGDIAEDDLQVKAQDFEYLEYYTEEEPFADLMNTFLNCMVKAKRGGLYCDGVVSGKQ